MKTAKKGEKQSARVSKKRVARLTIRKPYTESSDIKLLLDGSFKMPVTDTDADILGNAWVLLVIAYKYLGHKFSIIGDDLPNSRDRGCADMIDVAHARLRLAIAALGDAWNDVDMCDQPRPSR